MYWKEHVLDFILPDGYFLAAGTWSTKEQQQRGRELVKGKLCKTETFVLQEQDLVTCISNSSSIHIFFNNCYKKQANLCQK